MNAILAPQPSPPDTSDDRCDVCGLTAPFLLRDHARNTVTRYCRIHLPDSFPMAKSLTRLMEEMYLAQYGNAKNDSSPPSNG
jgi:hypothetical protein